MPSQAQDADSIEQHPLLRNGRRWFSPKEFATIFEVSEKWVYRRLEDGRIKCGRMGRNIRIPRSEVIRLDAELKVQVSQSGDGRNGG